jgi:hypothetical protein
MIEFIGTLYTPFGTTGNYSAIADWSTHFTVHRYTCTKVQHSYPGNGFITVSLSLQITHEVFLSQPNFFVANSKHSTQFNCYAPKLISWQTGVSKLDSARLLFFITTLHGPRRKHIFSIVGKVCLQRRCIATEITRFLLAYSLPRECVYRVVA